jgi:hypothetical protein
MRSPDGSETDLQQKKIRTAGKHDQATGQNDGTAKDERKQPTQCRTDDAAAETE